MDFSDKSYTVLITGATGFIGSSLVKEIISESKGREQCFLLPVRDVCKAQKMFRKEMNYSNARFILWNTSVEKSEKDVRDISVDYIIHCASPTRSVYMVSNPVETIECILTGTKKVLEFARKKDVRRMLYLSSMEVYGDIKCENGRRVSEGESGRIDILNTRSCYPLGKRMAENLCYSYYKEYNVPVTIVRLAQIFGAGILKDENRVFAQFANAVRYGENIVLHTTGESMGNYCDIKDAVNAILLLLEKGLDGEAYNVVNEANTMTIRQMAEMVAKEIAGGKIEVVYDIPAENQFGYAADTGLRLSSKKIEQLGWQSSTDLKTMYQNMIQYMNDYESIRK